MALRNVPKADSNLSSDPRETMRAGYLWKLILRYSSGSSDLTHPRRNSASGKFLVSSSSLETAFSSPA